jgi:hypothetical protein
MTLTIEQQQILDELMARVPEVNKDPRGLSNLAGLEPELIKSLLGISNSDLQKYLLTLISHKDKIEQWLLDAVDRNPLEASFQFLGLASVAFFVAEKDENPKVKTFVDAFYFVSTCASVGYADLFPVTQQGRAIASLVMTVGPGLAAKTLDRSKAIEVK